MVLNQSDVRAEKKTRIFNNIKIIHEGVTVSGKDLAQMLDTYFLKALLHAAQVNSLTFGRTHLLPHSRSESSEDELRPISLTHSLSLSKIFGRLCGPVDDRGRIT